jgi:hypothetical protein
MNLEQNIIYVIYLLFISTILLFSYLIFSMNKRGKSIGGNFKKHKMKKTHKEVNKFKLNSLQLMKTYLSWNQYIYDIESGKPVVNYYDFFYGIQKQLVDLVKENWFNISKDDLLTINKEIWTGKLGNVKKKIKWVSESNSLEKKEEDHISSKLLKFLIIQSIGNRFYSILDDEGIESRNKRYERIKTIFKKQKEKVSLTNSDEKFLENFQMEKTIYNEFKKNFSKIDLQILFFDNEKNELHILIDYEKLFNKSYKKLFSFYKKKGISLFIFI